MPIDKTRYPADWQAISRRIRFDRAGGRCEWCGVPHGAIGQRDPDGRFWSLDEIGDGINSGRLEACDCGEDQGWGKPIKIVLTVAHVDHDCTHNGDNNLAALCHRCHLRHDARQHATNAAATRRRRRMALGQGDLGL